MEIRTRHSRNRNRDSALVGCLGLLPAMDMADVMNGSLAACDSVHPSHADLVLLAAATSMVPVSKQCVGCVWSKSTWTCEVWCLGTKDKNKAARTIHSISSSAYQGSRLNTLSCGFGCLPMDVSQSIETQDSVTDANAGGTRTPTVTPLGRGEAQRNLFSSSTSLNFSVPRPERADAPL